jgi:hypothetical protein
MRARPVERQRGAPGCREERVDGRPRHGVDLGDALVVDDELHVDAHRDERAAGGDLRTAEVVLVELEAVRLVGFLGLERDRVRRRRAPP